MKTAMLTAFLFIVRGLAVLFLFFVWWVLVVELLSGCGGPPFSSVDWVAPEAIRAQSDAGSQPADDASGWGADQDASPVADAAAEAEADAGQVMADAAAEADAGQVMADATPDTGLPTIDAAPDAINAGPPLCCHWQSGGVSGNEPCIQHSWSCNRPKLIAFCDSPNDPPCPVGIPCQNQAQGVPGWTQYNLGTVEVCP
jgi:hypothetical protein